MAATTIDKTIDVDSETDSNHDTALTLACAGGHEELVELLINRGANIEHRDKKGFTPLILAATAGHEKVVDILLKHNAVLEAQSERTKDTPLSLACSGGRYEVVELLLSVGANKEHRNVSDYTPLSLAASGGYVNIIKLLLSNGAEINSRTGSKLGISPLMLAAMNGHTAAVKLLLDQGSDINAQIETNRNTALTLACFQGRHEVVSLLLDRKANVEHRAKTGLTPLMEAASGGYIEVGRVLLDKGADVNAAPVPTSRDTALTIAADKGHLKFVELLLSRGAAVEVKNKKGNSPLWLAAHGGHLSVVEILYQHCADIDSQDNRRVSCLMAAFRKGHTKTVKWMVQYVTQFPSDQEMNRFISTISDKELSEKCFDCMMIIRAAKEAQAVKANKNASILLEELDMERTREESRKAAAARRRERKKKKKMEKKEEKRRQMQGSEEPSEEVGNDADEKDSDKEEESDNDDDEIIPMPAHYREEGDSGIDQGSCSSTDLKAGNNAASSAVAGDKVGKNKNKKKNKSAAQQITAASTGPVTKESSGKNTRNNSPAAEEVSTSKNTKQSNKKDSKKEDMSKTKISETSSTSKTNSTATPSLNSNSSKKLDSCSNKKDEDKLVTSKKKESNKQREKENLAPKDNSSMTTAATTNKQAQAASVVSEKQKPEKLHETLSGTHTNANNSQQNGSNTNNCTTTGASVGGNRKSLVFSATRHPNTAISGNTEENKKFTDDVPKSSPPKRGEDGWKEVGGRKSNTQTTASGASSTSSSTGAGSAVAAVTTTTTTTTVSSVPEMTCKKVQVPVNAISRVIGRGGSNINAIRATTGAHIEVEKQGKNQSERSITIKGPIEATKQAHLLIVALIKDPDVDILQMLPRINTNIKASSLPLTVGTWDNKTALQSMGSSSSSSASSNPNNSATVAPNTNSSSIASPQMSTSTSKAIPSNSAKPISKTSSNPARGSAIKTESRAPIKLYAQQNARSSAAAGSSAAGLQKSKLTDVQSKNQSTYTNAVLSKVASKQATATFTNSSVGKIGAAQQTFAAQLLTASSTSSTSERHHQLGAASPKKNERITVAPYGRGKPINTSNTLPSLGGGSVNNTLAGPIGTFNVAEVAAINAAAAAAAVAANAAQNNSTNQQAARPVTPIGPPQKRNLASPSPNGAGAQQAQQILSQQPLAAQTSTSNLVISTGLNVSAGGTGYRSQLPSKISHEYSLFNDTTSYQNQWGENTPIYQNTNNLSGDILPKADASKAPGYNRNVLSSPVGSSKASSHHSSSPPGQSNIPLMVNNQPAIPAAATENLNILPAVNELSASSVAVASRSPGLTVATGGNDMTSEGPLSGAASGSSVVDSAAISPGVIKPPAPIGQPPTSASSGLAIQRPASSQHRTQPEASSNSSLNFGPIGSNAAANRPNGPGAIGEAPLNRYFEQATQMNFSMDPNLMVGTYGGNNHPISRLNPRASTFPQPPNAHPNQPGVVGSNKQPSQQQAPLGSGLYLQQIQQPPPPSGNNNFSAAKSLAPGRPQSQPQNAQNLNQRWYGAGGAAGVAGSAQSVYDPYMNNPHDILSLENGLPNSGSPAAMSPNQSTATASAAQSNTNVLRSTQQQPPAQMNTEDIRKVPRPIGTERASWKYGNYPNAAGGPGILMDDTITSFVSGAAEAAVGGQMPPWLLEKKMQPQQQHQHHQQQQQQQQQINWMKQYNNYYGNGGSAGNMVGGFSVGGPSDYQIISEQIHVSTYSQLLKSTRLVVKNKFSYFTNSILLISIDLHYRSLQRNFFE